MANSIIKRLYFILVIPDPEWPVGCYLAQTNDGKNILIDSGLPGEANEQLSFGGKNVVEQLAEIGLKPEDIDIVICTHYDRDHVGYHSAFPNAEFVVQRKHHEAALQELERFARSRVHWDLSGRKYRLLDGDIELFPGLQIIETSGHVPGHQSVLIHLPQTGAVLLAIDAVTRKEYWRADRKTGANDMDRKATIASTQKLIDLAEQEQVKLLVCGHDSETWEALQKLPEYYA